MGDMVMNKIQAMQTAEKINDLTLRQQELLDELWLSFQEASELRIKIMVYMRDH